jgi:hypothetical protein
MDSNIPSTERTEDDVRLYNALVELKLVLEELGFSEVNGGGTHGSKKNLRKL